jgi:DNA-binding NarL/FixJ family response regulator
LIRPARLLIADHGLTRLGMRMALEEEDVEICAEADDAEQAIFQAKLARPNICFIRFDLSGGGIAATRGILDEVPGAAVILLADTSDPDQLLSAIRAGAVGYVTDMVSSEQLRRVVKAVVNDQAVVPRSMVHKLVRELQAMMALADAEVTRREAQVLNMLRQGHSTAEIARRLKISPVTVRRHMSELVQKLGVENSGALRRPEPAMGNGRGRNSVKSDGGWRTDHLSAGRLRQPDAQCVDSRLHAV